MPPQPTLADLRRGLIQAQPGGIPPENLLNDMRLRPQEPIGEFTGADALNQIRRALVNFRAAPAGLAGAAKDTGINLLNLVQKGRRGGDITPAESLSVPLVGGAASLATGIPKGVGVFGGRLAAEFPKAKAFEFHRIRKMGATADDAFKQTGFFRGADGQLRFEIPDVGASFKPGVEKRIDEIAATGRVSRELTLGDVFNHPELFKAYPDLKKTKVVVTGLEGPNLGQFDPVGNQIVIRPADIVANSAGTGIRPSDAIKSTLLHEIQHAVQEIENFARGGNTDFMRLALAAQGRKDLADDRQAVFSAYRQLAGETEARLVQRRLFMENQQRRNTPPFSQEDFPRSQQIVRRPDVFPFPLGVEP